MLSTPSIRYTVTCPSPGAHRVNVSATFTGFTAEPLTLALPVWTPGSYLVREYARHIESFAAHCRGAPLACRKVQKNAWAIAHGGADEVTVEYVIYAHELTVRTNHCDAEHLYLNGAATFVHPLRDPCFQGVPCDVTLRLSNPSWRVHTALEALGGDVFRADDYDTLVDSPIECSARAPQTLQAAGRTHTLITYGDAEPVASRPLCADLAAIIEREVSLFGEAPYKHFLFILHLAPAGRGGLEHKHSTSILCAPDAFETDDGYNDLLSLFAHEFFHLWHVKRTRPAGLVPYDYEREQHTRLLWLFEGGTSYYDWLTLVRAERVTAHQYLKHLGAQLARLDDTPGRALQTLEDASFDAWIKHYRPDENTPNHAVSYYVKGELVSLLLDLEIRSRSAHTRSLDDVMRWLWQQHGRTHLAVPEDGIEAIFAAATGVDLSDVLDGWVRSTEELPIATGLAGAGLLLRPRRVRGASLGVRTRTDGARLVVITSYRDGAGARAGLSAGDEIVAIDGRRVDENSLRDRLRRREAGERAKVTLARRQRLLTVEVTLDAMRAESFEIVANEEATAQERAAATRWLGPSAQRLWSEG